VPRLEEVCSLIRSKNAGPFMITIDMFFHDQESFDLYVNSRALQPEGIAPLFGVRPDQVGFYPVRNLHVLKLSYPRKDPQGGMIERDLHGGQQFARIVDLELL
jgi:Domain of unknown function (DUF4387)